MVVYAWVWNVLRLALLKKLAMGFAMKNVAAIHLMMEEIVWCAKNSLERKEPFAYLIVIRVCWGMAGVMKYAILQITTLTQGIAWCVRRVLKQ
jgi:hypothetical protein